MGDQADENWLSRMVLANLREQLRNAQEDPGQVEALLQRSAADLSGFLAQYTECGALHAMPWPTAGEERLTLPNYGPSQWQHLKEGGLEGGFLAWTPSSDMPIFQEWDQLASLMANCVLSSRAALSRL